MLPRRDQNQMFEELYHLQNCEMALGIFYQELATVYHNEHFFWEAAVADEVNHARWIGQLIVLVSSSIDKYMPGVYRTELLKTFAEGIYHDVQKIHEQRLSNKEIMGLALNYERSGIEQKPYNAVKSTAPEYLRFVDSIATELKIHNDRITKYISQKLETA
jgi:hypothetical protein